MQTQSMWCPLKALELLFRHGAAIQWNVCVLREDTSKEQAATARIIGASYCQPPSSSGVTWEYTETEPKSCSGSRNSLNLATLRSSAPPIQYVPIFSCLGNHHVQFRMTDKETVPNFVDTTCSDIPGADGKKNVWCSAWSWGHVLLTWQQSILAKDPVLHSYFPLVLEEEEFPWGSSFSLLCHRYCLGQ